MELVSADDTPRDAPGWAVLDAALDRALDLEGAARDAYLASLDPALRAALEGLLRDALREDSFLDRAEAVLAPFATAPEAGVAEGVRVGAYLIDALVGEGGMGRVYRAHRADGAFDQTVALKVVRQSLMLAGTDVAARLRRERDLLAVLDHPGIARLIDGGETADGVPYLVTEFVDGAPITTWADEHDLGVRDRVRLAAEVARAVDHAHRRSVVHRDLKPSNVLVAERDGPGGRPRPVVLDFGIAKLLHAAGEAGGDGASAFPLTQTGVRLLTPAYAAPELFDPTATVTTAADVYGLGALLYELLTGQRPHDDAATGGPPTTEPTWPSRAVRASSVDAPPTAAAVRTSRALRGDLDTICLKALQPDPARRYASAAAFADDLDRCLADEPIEARRDSAAYVAGRLVRRHRAMVAAAALALVGLAGGLGVAVASLAEEREARAEAEEAAERAEDVADLLGSLLSEADPERAGVPDRTVRDALGAGLKRIEQVRSAPLRGVLLGRVGEVYAGLGDVVTADSLFALALPLVVATTQDEEDRVRAAYGDTRLRLGDEARAADLFRTVVAVRPPTDSLGVRVRTGLLGAIDPGSEADAVAADLARAGASTERAGVAAEALLGLGIYYVWTLERPAEGIGPARRARALLDSLRGPDHRSTRIATATLAKALSMMGRTDPALVLYREMIASTRQIQGVGSRDEAYAWISLADACREAGRLAEAGEAYDTGLALAQRHLPDEHPDLGWWDQSRASVRNDLGEYALAERHALRARAVARAVGSEPMAARAQGQLGLALVGQGRRDAGRRALGEAADLLSRPTGMGASYDRDHLEALRRVRAALETGGLR